ncbi:MAG: chemotaxis protein CheY [Cyanobacteria bacterium RYN_339]|nr:chemotaxis protein CheY [Cyanobacteria bacterium RYN_339]
MGRKLLLIDDDRELAELLQAFVARNGYELAWADRPSRGFELLADRPELVLLDIMLPEQDGFAVCQAIRATGNATPVIMLTARGDDDDRIRGLQIGADDYLPKPFNPKELLARVEAVLRRGPARPQGRGLDPDQRSLRLGEREITLTPNEYRLLDAMLAQPGRAFSRDQLLELSEDASESFDRAIDIHMSRLRSKIEADPRQPKHLITVRGVGYRWDW